MRRLYLFFVCLGVFAACSPRNFSGEQVARTEETISTIDSASLKSYVDHLVHEEFQKQLNITEFSEQTTVKELFSEPDSTGNQYVKERTTTCKSRSRNTSATSTNTKEEELHEKSDSSSHSETSSNYIEEEQKKFSGEVKNWCPWWVYILAFVAAMLVGLYLARRAGKICRR